MGSNVVLSVSASRSGRPTIKAVSRKFGSKAIVLLQHSGKRNSVGNGLKWGACVSCGTSCIREDLDLPRYLSRIRPHPNDHSFVLAGAVARNGKGERKKTLMVVDIESMITRRVKNTTNSTKDNLFRAPRGSTSGVLNEMLVRGQRAEMGSASASSSGRPAIKVVSGKFAVKCKKCKNFSKTNSKWIA